MDSIAFMFGNIVVFQDSVPQSRCKSATYTLSRFKSICYRTVGVNVCYNGASMRAEVVYASMLNHFCSSGKTMKC